jgi:hypothetical protein
LGEVDQGLLAPADVGRDSPRKRRQVREHELGRRVYAETTNDFGVEASAREALGERRDVLDEFDRVGFAVAFALAWGHAAESDPSLSEGELAELAAEAADLALRAGRTPGGWEAMAAGACSELDSWTGVVASFHSAPA